MLARCPNNLLEAFDQALGQYRYFSSALGMNSTILSTPETHKILALAML
jgi:hypothetical protein